MTREEASQPLDTTTSVETPEHVRFRYHVAGPGRRAFAYLLDLLVRAGIFLLFALLAYSGGLLTAGIDAAHGLILVVWFVLEWFYYVLFELLWSGRTLGKRAMRLRVLADTGHPLRFGQSFLRNLLRAADLLPAPALFGAFALPTYALGTLVMARDERFRRLGDLAAGTMVVVEERAFVGRPLWIQPPPSAAELASLPQRLPISGEELEALELFLRREDRLPPGRVHELAEMVAPVFGARLGVLPIRDPVRFLKVVYARARALPAGQPQVAQQPWMPGGPAPFGAVGHVPVPPQAAGPVWQQDARWRQP